MIEFNIDQKSHYRKGAKRLWKIVANAIKESLIIQ